MLKLHELKVASVEKNTPETVVVTLDLPDALKHEFEYKQGQHLTLCKTIEGEDLRRSYSICSGVAEAKLQVAIRRVEGGRFSTFANENLLAGEILNVMAPAGHFYVDLDPLSERTYVAFAAGSGITPIMSIIKTTLAAEPNARFMLFYGNRSKLSTIFINELAFLKNQYMERFTYWHFLSQEDLEIDFFKGRLDAGKVKDILGKIVPADQIDHAFVCGPDAMIDAVVGTLVGAGLSGDKIHFEKFLSEGQKAVAPKRAADTSSLTAMTLIIDGDEVNMNASKDVAVLDAALDMGLDVPFACKGGVCCTCRAKVLEGTVEMVLNQGLEPEEVAAGYVLTCQSFVTSDKAVLSFDE
ncbi:1,2-phenylacetyl-CoA epoxidase subunit PaaE [Kordiimonas pumila]|uniref:1,2-phenylacetyl-CoA epoxidase subunit PaaE n=1 Tax=Kordiimonas pumila TaxID=2161677 RepID=A0ABV7CZF4_9PROT|nr:1,2-phenylacetyl-CoA epoxidase subunit PaaE [Kordiimonas pumila]